jgi:hypothetical protein
VYRRLSALAKFRFEKIEQTQVPVPLSLDIPKTGTRFLDVAPCGEKKRPMKAGAGE